MRLEKQYTETIDVTDPENYCAAPERYILTELRRRFEGRCHKGAFVLRILRVVRRSDCRLVSTNLTAQGFVAVEFVAEVSVVAMWDILTGVAVADRSPLIIGKTTVEGDTIVAFHATPEVATVRVGQTVSVRVLRVQYNPNQPCATAAGSFLTCDKAAPAYRIAEGGFSAADARALAPLAARVRDLLAARAALAAARPGEVAFFEALLYAYPRVPGGAEATVETRDAPPWVGPAAFPLPADAAAANLLDVVSRAGDAGVAGVWARDLAIHRASPLAARVPPGADVPAGWAEPVDANPRTAFAEMLTTVHGFLKAINEMVAVYDTPRMVEDHKNVWLVMRAAQRPAPAGA